MVSSDYPKILCVGGARPNFMKLAPVIDALQAVPISIQLVHTGQHYDAAMNELFFQQLKLPDAHINLEVGSGSHAEQTAEIMRRFEPILQANRPNAVVVVGDVNSTIACALVAAKMGVPIFHVEAGLRSFDRSMPEEINRVLTDQLADLLFTTERGALENLKREGIDPERVKFVGNVMIDCMRAYQPSAVPVDDIVARFGDEGSWPYMSDGYAVLTLHRPVNVDDPRVLGSLLQVLSELSMEIPIAFPVHPRTEQRINQAGLKPLVENGQVLVLPPQGYLEMLGLLSSARLVLTDSGGIQEETTALGIPCVTLRESTERPVTVEQGTNTLVGADPDKIRSAVQEILETGGKVGRLPEYWDGNAAQRIAGFIADWLLQDRETVESSQRTVDE